MNLRRALRTCIVTGLMAATLVAGPASASTSLQVTYVLYTNTTSVDFYYSTPTTSVTQQNKRFINTTENGNYYWKTSYATPDEYDIPMTWISTNSSSNNAYVQCDIIVDGRRVEMQRGYGPYASAYC